MRGLRLIGLFFKTIDRGLTKTEPHLLADSPCFDDVEVSTFVKMNRDNTLTKDRDGALKLKGPIASTNFMLPVFRSSVDENFWDQYAFSGLQQAELFDMFVISTDDSLRGAFIKDDALITLLSKNKDSVKQKNLEFFRNKIQRGIVRGLCKFIRENNPILFQR